jgi:hypothetical protein
VRGRIAALTTLAAVAVLAGAVVTRLPETWNAAKTERRAWERLPDAERQLAYVTRIPLRLDIFEFWQRHLRPGDRYYVQIPPDAFSAFADKPTIVRAVGRVFLLPAVEVEKPERADVILSWDSDPGLLPFRYSDQVRAGLQLIFVSRIDRGT